jgi:hypothetical protein
MSRAAPSLNHVDLGHPDTTVRVPAPIGLDIRCLYF